MSDLVERLRQAQSVAGHGHPQTARRYGEAADELDRLRAENERLTERLDSEVSKAAGLIIAAEQRADTATLALSALRAALADIDTIASEMGHSDTLGFTEARERILECTTAALSQTGETG